SLSCWSPLHSEPPPRRWLERRHARQPPTAASGPPQPRPGDRPCRYACREFALASAVGRHRRPPAMATMMASDSASGWSSASGSAKAWRWGSAKAWRWGSAKAWPWGLASASVLGSMLALALGSVLVLGLAMDS